MPRPSGHALKIAQAVIPGLAPPFQELKKARARNPVAEYGYNNVMKAINMNSGKLPPSMQHKD